MIHPGIHPDFQSVFVILLHKFKAWFGARVLDDFQAQDLSF